MATRDEVTKLLQQFDAGDPKAFELLTTLLYDDLRSMASRRVHERIADHTLTTRALVNEAFLRLYDQKMGWQNRKHFLGIAAKCMRRILIDNARKRKAEKRGGPDQHKVGLDDMLPDDESHISLQPSFDMLALNAALEKLRAEDQRVFDIVDLHFGAGLTFEEIAKELDLGLATVKREWHFGKTWLKREMDAPEDGEKI